jgi:hypothetical protein
VGAAVELIGTVVRLQIQRDRLKPGPAGGRVYDPSPLLEVPSLTVGPRGVKGPDGALDVHHADHPHTRNVRLLNGLSVLPRGHYLRMREMFGPHLVDGIAGESLLLDTPHLLADLDGPLVLETDDRSLAISDAAAMPPCVEFSRFATRRSVGDTGPEVLAAMEQLGGGMRGFHLHITDVGVVRAGARLLRA